MALIAKPHLEIAKLIVIAEHLKLQNELWECVAWQLNACFAFFIQANFLILHLAKANIAKIEI